MRLNLRKGVAQPEEERQSCLLRSRRWSAGKDGRDSGRSRFGGGT